MCKSSDGGTAMEINVKNARDKISSLLNRVQDGEEVIILRRGKEVARLVSPHNEGKRLPSLKKFRASIKATNEPLSETVITLRSEERY
ncbi:MAG: type II toxin-antitoxin system prevent-host-death family antitoxin [Syntrophus sp. (in: bacteria)]|nr:type II toxin-antitoxin system prevent-host-death family antitoxin [Syntrophus sp. (in: bacteria)]MBA4419077.1 type II toxin-antitoxin system prevent-host-death family antitoxin [Syntrophus sp. (in: bacteria)]